MKVRLAIVLAGAALVAMAPGAVAAPSLSARSAVLIEETTGQRLYGSGPERELPIASATKLMTALVVLEHAKLDAVFTHPNYYSAPIDSQIGLRPGERMSVRDLMVALLLPSADDAAQDLAWNVGRGSVGRFIGMMNTRARQLRLTHTHYSTPIGLDTPGNYSSASDLVKLASFVLQRHPFFRHVVSLSVARLGTGDHPRVVTNRNTLLGHVSWVNGVKTGHTRGAGYVLVGSGTRGRLTLISAVLGTPDESARNADTLALLSYGFDNFRLVRPIRGGTVLARLPVKDQPSLHAPVVASRTFVHVVPRSARVTTRLQLPRELKGPLKAGTVVGSVHVVAGRQTIARIPLRLSQSIPAVSPLTLAARFLIRPSTLLFITVLLLGVAFIALRRRGRASARHAGTQPRPAEPPEPA